MTPIFIHDPDHTQKYARIEEERRFLLRALLQGLLETWSFIRIIDSYIPGTRLRLRRMESPEGDLIAMKFGQKYQATDIESHQTIMTNMYLNEAEHQVLSTLGGLQIIKRRYPYEFEQQWYVTDVFEGNLAGLFLAEIEGRPGVDLSLLPVPGYADLEVTGNLDFSSSNLAGLAAVELQKILSERKVI